MQSLLAIFDSSPGVAYLIGVPAIMVGSVLLVGAILALLGPRPRHRDDLANNH